jgi:hypothetical protein
MPSPDQSFHNLSILTPQDKQTPEYQKMRERIGAVKAEIKQVAEDPTLSAQEKLAIINDKLIPKLEKAQTFNRSTDKEDQPDDFIEHRTDTNQEIHLNLTEIKQESIDFYNQNNLPEFSQSLPDTISFSKENQQRIREAMQQGFDSALILPDLSTQDQAGIPQLKTKLSDTELPGLQKTEQYTPSYLESPIESQHSIRPGQETKRQSAYLLLYSQDPILESTKNKTYPQCEEIFKQNNWDGLTLPEFYLIERKECAKHQDHRMFAYNNNNKESQWTWLLDSHVPDGCVRAYWFPDYRQVHVSWLRSVFAFSLLGARPAVVVQIEI